MLALIARARERVLARSRGIIENNLLDAFSASTRTGCPGSSDGASVFPDSPVSIDDFAATLVQREGVLLLPASQFGYPGNHFRLGYGRTDMPQALEGLARHLRTN